MRQSTSIDVSRARIYYPNGEVEAFKNQVFAIVVWLALPKGKCAAFRGVHDSRPVRPSELAGKR